MTNLLTDHLNSREVNLCIVKVQCHMQRGESRTIDSNTKIHGFAFRAWFISRPVF